MGGFCRSNSGLSRALAALALLAMAVRALVPAGYMLAPEQNGRTSIVTLCTGHGLVDVVVDHGAGKGRGDGGKPADHSDAPCAFAAIAQIAPPQAPPTILPPTFRTAPATFEAAHARPGLGLAAPPPWATGPPLSA